MLNDSPVAVVLPSTNLEKAKDFYQNQLALKLISGDGPLIFEAGNNTRLQVYETKPQKPEHTQAEFRVSDIAAVVKELEAKGVKFEDYEGMVDHVMQSGSGKLAWIKDPDGNFLALLEWAG